MTEDDQTKMIIEDRKAILDGIFQLTKWVIATLFLLNGAAALAVLSRPGMDPLVGSTIALFYVNGVLASIIAAISFAGALLSSYGRVMHMIRPTAQHALTIFMTAQILTGTVTLLGVSSSVSYFVTGTKMWGEVTIAEAQQRKKLALQSASKKQSDVPPKTREEPGSGSAPSGKAHVSHGASR